MLALPIGRRGAKKILFYAESPVKYAMFRPIQARMQADHRIEFFFAGQLRGQENSKRMARRLGVESARAIRRGLASLCRFDLFVTADYDLWRPFDGDRLPITRAPRVQLFHGASVRNGAVQPKMRRYQSLFTVGPYMHRAFVKAGLFAADDPRLARIGMPKVDRLVDGTLDREALRRELSFEPGRPVVMLAPTWLRSSPITQRGTEFLDALAAGPWNLLVKLHDKFFDPRFNTIDWRRRLADYARLPNCRVLIDEYDAVPYLDLADLLISDVSSIANEFTLTDRPLVFLAVEDEAALREQYPQLDLETWGQRAGAVVREPAGCVRAVERALADPEQDGALRRALARDIFFEPGRAAERAAAELYRLLELDPPRPPAAERRRPAAVGAEGAES